MKKILFVTAVIMSAYSAAYADCPGSCVGRPGVDPALTGSCVVLNNMPDACNDDAFCYYQEGQEIGSCVGRPGVDPSLTGSCVILNSMPDACNDDAFCMYASQCQ